MFYKLKPFADSVFNIAYKRPESVPVRIDVSDKVITITGYVEFDPKLLVPFKKSEKINDALLSSKPEGYTYADAAIEGICENWGKSYLFEGATEPVKVNVNLIRKDDPDAVIPEGQRFFKVRHTNISGTSFVTSPIWRMGWGFFLTGCPEAAMINWSPRHPGTINMNDYGRLSSFKQVVAHEFGHVLGLGDAYDAHYRFYYEAPGTDSYIMNNNSSVNAREVEMALRAHETGKMQYFPYKISLRKYFGRLFSKFTRRIIK
ncbi:hypothetical protein SAMN05216413_2472 [Ruminococcaceae bacterium KH2T8]|nr:hypothetical protein SAMN05216413_2472 [Ruminococcaceae bacterium KH2T8]